MFDDLREFIKQAKELGEYKLIEGADWDLEIGAITELQKLIPDSPLLEFDKIKGYKAGYRVASNVLNTPKRVALALGLPLESKGLEQVKAWRERIRGGVKLIPPVEVKTGPVKENVKTGDDINLFEFPVPKWHELDGGRYIGTGHMVVQRDPDEGWINMGAYRVQIHDKDTATVHYIDGRQGDVIRRKYWDRGLAAPAAIVCGQDPLLWLSSTNPVPWGVSEYDYTGGIRNRPLEVVRGEVTDLLIPATAEIVLEGEMVLPGTETRIEGPFGEWEGYYGGRPVPEPAFKVKAVLHRNDPIIMGAPPNIGPFDYQWGRCLTRSAELWDELDRHIPGVKGVWLPPEGRLFLMVIISLKQMYTGHAKRAAMITSGWYGTACLNRFTIIVDDDIDPSNIGEVLWALTTRCDPATAIDIIGGCWGMRSDPLLSPEKRDRDHVEASKAIIYACRPYHWMKDFPPSTRSSPELLDRVKEKFML